MIVWPIISLETDGDFSKLIIVSGGGESKVLIVN